MKTIILTVIVSLFAMFQIQAQNYSGTWKTMNNSIKITHTGSKISGTFLPDGGKLTGTTKDGGIVTGYFRLNKKLYNFSVSYKSNGDHRLVGKYWNANTDKLGIVFTKYVKPNHDLSIFRSTEPYTKPANGSFPTQDNKDYEGKYQVTVTRILVVDSQLSGKEVVTLYGSIGVRMKAESQSGLVEVKDANNRPPRLWEERKHNASLMGLSDKNIKSVVYNGKNHKFHGVEEVDKMRQFNLKGELANEKLLVNVQAKLSAFNSSYHISFPWKQRNLYAKDLTPSKEYFLKSDKMEGKYLLVGFKLEKF